MTNGWFLWYGLRIGLSYDMAMCLPFGELADLIAMEQIRNEGAKKKKSRKAEENEFWRLMGFDVYPNPQVGYGALCVENSLPV